MDATYIDLTVRLSLALILGGAIGIEREYRAKEAGFRTHFLVALGSALFCVVSQYGFGFDLKDSSRVAAQVVSGIGFLGALKERRLSKEEFVEASIEIKAKRGFHTLEILDYMNDFSDVTISTIK